MTIFVRDYPRTTQVSSNDSPTHSFDDEIDGAVNSNLVILAIGCSLIYFYIAAVLGNLNKLEQRVGRSCMVSSLIQGSDRKTFFKFCTHFICVCFCYARDI